LFWQANTVNTLTVSSTIQGAIGIEKMGGGQLNLTNTANAFTGKAIVWGGTLGIAADGSLGAGFGGNTLDAISFQGGAALQFLGNVNLSANRGITLYNNVTVDTQANTATIGGVVSGGSFGITKTGTGTLTLAGANTNTGNFIVNNGTVILTGSLVTDA